MYKLLIKDASLYSMSSVLARGFSLITVPIFTRILSPADYGALDLLSYFSVFFPLIFGLALDQGVARYFVASKDEVYRKKIASSVLIYTVIALLIVAVSMLPLSNVLAGHWLDGQVDSSTVRIVLVYVWVHSIFLVLNNQLRYMFLAKEYAACNVGSTVVSMTLSIWFVAFLDQGVYGFFLAQTISQAFFAALSFYYGRSEYAIVFDWAVFRKVARYSLPLVPSTVAFVGMQYADRYAINELRGLQEVGLYGIGARLATLINLFLNGFHSAWYPMVMRTYMEEGAVTKFRTIFNYYIFVTCSVLISISLFSEEILLFLATEVFSGGYVVVPLLISSAILASIGNYFTFGIQIKEKSSFRLYINISGLALNVFLNIVLIQMYGIIGAALATFLSFAYMAAVSMWFSQRLYKVDYQWSRILVAMAIALAVSHIVVLYQFQTGVVAIAVKMLVVIFVVVILARLLRIRHVKAWLAVLRERPMK